MGGKNTICNDEKVNKSNFYKNKKLFKIDDMDVNKVLVSKKLRVKQAHFNALVNIMIMMTLDHCVQNFLRLGMLNALIVVKQCLSRVLIKSH